GGGRCRAAWRPWRTRFLARNTPEGNPKCREGVRMLALLVAAAALSPDYEQLIAYDTVPIAPKVMAFMPKKADTAIVSGNSIAVFGDDGVLVVDSGHFPEATRRMIAQIQAHSTKPVRWLVNTHWHSDHNHGNALYQQAFPGLSIIGTEETRKNFEQPFIKDEMATMRQQADQVRALLKKGVDSRGKPLTDARRAYFNQALHELEIFGPDCESAKVAPPDLTFENRLVLHLGGRDAQVLFLGRGNTAGDTLVWLPDAKILMPGDLVVYPAPFAFGSFFSEWGPTLRKAIALQPATIIPGHGPVMHDTRYLELVAEAADAVSARVKALAKQGLSLDDVKAKLDVQDIREKFARGDESLKLKFDGFFLGP